jgi:hypothetical protein
MGVSPSQAVYVGDRRDVDAEAARSAGMHGIWLDRSGASDDSEFSMRIGSLSALPGAINADRTKLTSRTRITVSTGLLFALFESRRHLAMSARNLIVVGLSRG